MLNSGDTLDDFGLDAEFLPFHSQDLFDELSQDSVTRFKSTSSLSSDNETDGYFTANDSIRTSQLSRSSSPVEIDKSDGGLMKSPLPMKIDKCDNEEIEEESGWMTVGSKKNNWGRLNKKWKRIFNLIIV